MRLATFMNREPSANVDDVVFVCLCLCLSHHFSIAMEVEFVCMILNKDFFLIRLTCNTLFECICIIIFGEPLACTCITIYISVVNT